MSYWKTICIAGTLLAATALRSPAQTFTTLVFFTDGSNVISTLVQGTDGNLYGTSNNGGTSGQGSVFRVTPSGILTTLYSFCSQPNCMDGSLPFSSLALGTDGNFYGTTQNGGTASMGTVFKITPDGIFAMLHSFSGTDGNAPDAGLVTASDGNFYGTTSAGGANGAGTLFRITPQGAVTTLHSFNGSDGSGPNAPLIQATDGNLYGTAYAGGNQVSSCFPPAGCGTAFKISLKGSFTLLHEFDFTNGARPYAPLMQAASGAFYGTTFEGGNVAFHGCSGGCGTIFKIGASGAFVNVHKFLFGDGGNPYSGLVQGTDGNLYGESTLAGDGNIYKLTLPGTIATVYNFTAASEGGGTTALVQSTDGKFYGTYGVPGAVFSEDVGLGAFVAFVLPSGKVGKTAQILGQGFTGSTAVTFNGVLSTNFSVDSDTYITAVVPSGATTGPVVVTTPTGTLTSNKNFRVTQ